MIDFELEVTGDRNAALAAGGWHGRRRQQLADARRARNSGREREAIALYKAILLEEPRNVDVALRVAPLLARRGDAFEAWQLFRTAARELARERRFDECLSIYHEACRWVPHEYDAWRLAAELEMKLGREDAAFETLLDGRTHFRHPGTRAQAVALLARARAIEPWDPEIVLDLARLYARSDQTEAALDLLAAIAQRVHGSTLRRVRALQWRSTLSMRYALLWCRALWSSDGVGDRAARDFAEGPLVAEPLEFESVRESDIRSESY